MIDVPKASQELDMIVVDNQLDGVFSTCIAELFFISDKISNPKLFTYLDQTLNYFSVMCG
jgi:predicted esterase YcpF (UPF0227 family)